MSKSKWKYALLPADERIKLVRSGNSDVYNSEMERTRSVIKEREKLGLDTSSQVKWANTLGYSYNLSNAESMGISAENVDKKGYGERMLSSWKEPEKSTEKKLRTQSGTSLHRVQLGLDKMAEEKRIKKRFADYKTQAKKDMEDYSSVVREGLINEGASLNGGKAADADLRTRAQLMSMLADYDEKMQSAISENNAYYDSLADKSYERAYKNAALDLEKRKNDESSARWYAQQNYDYLRDKASDEKWRAEYDYKNKEAEENRRRWESEFARDGEKWRAETDFSRDKEANDRAEWSAEFEFEKAKEAADNRQWQARFDFDRQKEATDYEQWLISRGRR